MGSLANSSSLQTTIQENPLPLPLSAFSQLSLLTLKPSPRLRLMPTMAIMDMALPTTGTVMAWLTTVTMVMLTLMLTDTTTARGPLMLSPLLMLTTAITTVMPHTVMLTAVTTVTLMLTVATTDTDAIAKLLLFC